MQGLSNTSEKSFIVQTVSVSAIVFLFSVILYKISIGDTGRFVDERNKMKPSQNRSLLLNFFKFAAIKTEVMKKSIIQFKKFQIAYT
jgi:hypothetical protein